MQVYSHDEWIALMLTSWQPVGPNLPQKHTLSLNKQIFLALQHTAFWHVAVAGGNVRKSRSTCWTEPVSGWLGDKHVLTKRCATRHITHIFIVPFGPRLLFSTSWSPRAALMFTARAAWARATSAFGFSALTADILLETWTQSHGDNGRDAAEVQASRSFHSLFFFFFGGVWRRLTSGV